MRLRRKIFLVTLGSLLSTAVFLMGLAMRALHHQLEYELQLRSLSLTRVLQQVSTQDLQSGETEEIRSLMDSFLGDPDLEEAYVLNMHGDIVASKTRSLQPAGPPMLDAAARVEALRSLTARIREVHEGDRRYRMVYQRIWKETDSGLETLALAVTKFSYYRADRQIKQTVLAMAVTTVLFTFAALGVSLFLSARILSPIEQLRRAAEAVAAGHFNVSLPVGSPDEIGQLARGFAHMAQEVRSAREFLEEKVRERTRELEQSRATLVQSEKMAAVGQLAAGIAHEINNPLGVIRGFAESALELVPKDSNLRLPLESIERETLRCRELVKSLLTFSRSSAETDRHDIDLNEAVQEAMALVAAQANHRAIPLVSDLCPSLPTFWASKVQIQQVLVNLCANALDAMPTGGTLTVSTAVASQPDGDWVVLKVRDTGVGIPESIRARIFEPFFTTKDIGKGTGLGLALVYEMVQNHGGAIDVESTEGAGTVFTLRFPAQQSKAQAV